MVMKKTSTINTRIDPKLKHEAEAILQGVGLSTAEAIRLFYTQICLQKGLPFELRLPNEETLDAMDELEAGKGTVYHSMRDVWRDIGNA